MDEEPPRGEAPCTTGGLKEMELRHVKTAALDLSLGRLRQIRTGAVRAMEASLRSKGQLSRLPCTPRGPRPSQRPTPLHRAGTS
jgi:hypothetical protein